MNFSLNLSLKVLNITKDDEIIVPTITFISPVNAVLYCNASSICVILIIILMIKLEIF